MSKIEDGLHAHHASIEPSGSHPASNSVQEAATANSSNTASSGAYELPFAKVTDVTAGSPADHAGLRVGDKIRRFGTVNWMNHEELGKVAETVQRNEGVR